MGAAAAEFAAWLDARQAAPTIRRMRTAAEHRRQFEIARAGRGLGNCERIAVDRVTKSVLNALLHAPTVALRCGEAALADGLIEALESGLGPRPTSTKSRQESSWQH
jgi:glutamyl-tRNA reductase